MSTNISHLAKNLKKKPTCQKCLGPPPNFNKVKVQIGLKFLDLGQVLS